MTDIILTGYMGTGKSSVGRLVARRYGFPFLDTDELLEDQSGLTIAEMFASTGEEGFRRRESALWHQIITGDGRVIATGGGTLLEAANRGRLRPDQRVFCLQSTAEVIAQRLSGDSNRPLLPAGGAPEIERGLAPRRPIYDRFESIDTTALTVESVAEEIGNRAQLEAVDLIPFSRDLDSEILLREGIAEQAGAALGSRAPTGPVLLVTDRLVSELGHAEAIARSLGSAGYCVKTAAIPVGEKAKTLATLETLYQECGRMELDRDSTIVSVGGGVVGDVAGLLAATYMRGLRFVNLPTTLLAQVDASVGGKVGVDFGGAKNIIGAFHPARLILIDPLVLSTLPRSLLSAGMAEIVKTALICSPALAERLMTLDSVTDVLKFPDIIRACVQQKARIVRADPYEAGVRALLNFGHTIGHGIEAASNFRLSHGQAVSIGMVAETRLAVQTGHCSDTTLDCLLALLTRFELPTGAAGVNESHVLECMRHDKKRVRGSLRFALPSAIGCGRVVSVDPAEVQRAVATSLGDSL